jgi:hypothetical protein
MPGITGAMRRLWTKGHTSGTNAMSDPRHTQGQSLVEPFG